MRLHLSLLRSLLLSLVMSGCLVDADLSGSGYVCEANVDCAPGFLCAAGRCAASAAVPDAGRDVADGGGDAMAPNQVVRLRHPSVGSEWLTLDPAQVRAAQDAGYVSEGVVFTASPTLTDALVPIYRLSHPTTLDILFTASRSERDSAVSDYGYVAQGIAFYVAPAGTANKVAVHRVQRLGVHRYPIGPGERDTLVNAGWKYEHVLFAADPP